MNAVTPIQDRLGRWKRFVEGGAGPYMFYVNFPWPEEEAKLPPNPPLWPDKARERIERRWVEYELMRRKVDLIDDDLVPFASNVTGTEIFAEAFGCKVHYPDNTNPFALPLVASAEEADKLRAPDLGSSSLAYLFDIADALYRRGGPEMLMKPVDLQSPMDVVALIWNKSDLFCAMIDEPEAVQALAAKVRGLICDFCDEWFARYGTTFVAHYPEYVMHGGITMSVDEVGAVSEEMFEAFFAGELTALSERYGGLGVHCCADAAHQWANFKAIPGLKVINHVVPPTRDPSYITDALAYYGPKIAQMPQGWKPDGPPEFWPDQYPTNARVIFGCGAEDAQAAARIAEKLQQRREESASSV
jgi:hypothetical protein